MRKSICGLDYVDLLSGEHFCQGDPMVIGGVGVRILQHQ